MKKFRPLVLIPASAAVFLMICIFISSAQPGITSGELSFDMSYIIAESMYTEVPEGFSIQDGFVSQDESDVLSYYVLNKALSIELVIRKLAHFLVYLLLGLSVFFSCYMLLERLKSQISYTLIICTLYAVSDEVHQLFVPGRAGMIEDVLLDISGSVCGIALALLCIYKAKRLFITGTANSTPAEL